MDDLDDAGFLSVNRWPRKELQIPQNHWDTKVASMNKAPCHPETGTPKFEL